MNPAIRVENLSKRYRIGTRPTESYRTLRESIGTAVAETWRNVVRLTGRPDGDGGSRNGDAHAGEFWALKDVSFEVRPGEVVGIIGRNGAGKSTLLKILSRITEPTLGRAEFMGRMGSLLEVGTGFHPELSGRENVFLNGSILGMSRREIARHFDEIVAFAEIERFIDTPVKRYSSGMYVRLAFAVAAHLQPEILLVDEVLAVGDAGFQKKCLGKMRDVTRQGRTVLFVSHNMGSMKSLCERAIWLQRGQLVRQGDAKAVIDAYLSESALTTDRVIELSAGTSRVNRSDELLLRSLEWTTEVPLRHGEPLCFRIHYEAKADVADVAFGLGFSTIDGTRILTFDSDDDGPRRSLTRGERGWVELHGDELPVTPGIYSLDLGVRSGDRFTLSYLPGFALTEIVPGPRTPDLYTCFPGAGVRKSSRSRWSHGVH